MNQENNKQMRATSPLHPHAILDCLISRRFGVEYQPFVSTTTGEVLCHEALARFIDADGGLLPPDQVFEALHDNPLLLLHAELEMKRLQLAEAPQHLALARQMGFDLVQGFLYTDRFIRRGCLPDFRTASQRPALLNAPA